VFGMKDAERRIGCKSIIDEGWLRRKCAGEDIRRRKTRCDIPFVLTKCGLASRDEDSLSTRGAPFAGRCQSSPRHRNTRRGAEMALAATTLLPTGASHYMQPWPPASLTGSNLSFFACPAQLHPRATERQPREREKVACSAKLSVTERPRDFEICGESGCSNSAFSSRFAYSLE
jgi:hypothetical protein